VDTVLGLSMTPTTVGLVLVEGHEADGATIDHDAFEVRAAGGVSAVDASRQAAAAVMETQAIAAAGGHRLHSIGVTWSDGADAEASLLLESLTDSGFDNVVPVRLPEATEALAWGVGRVIGYEKTAVCVIEDEAVIFMVVDTRDSTVHTAVSHVLETDHDLISWLAAVFERDHPRPEGLVVVGLGDGQDGITSQLENALGVPVSALAEAELALARGAALASAQSAEFPLAPVGEEPTDDDAGRARSWPLSYIGALTMLVAGVLVFVVSLSLAVGLRLTPEKDSGSAGSRQVANTAGMPAAPQAVVPPAPPPPQEVPAPIANTPPELPPPAAPPEPAAIAPQFDIPDAPPTDLPAAPVLPVVQEPLAPLPPAVPPPPIAPPPVAQVPVEKPGILARIRDKLRRNPDPAPVQQAPVPEPPPDVILPPP
jgi:hypothetical protein